MTRRDAQENFYPLPPALQFRRPFACGVIPLKDYLRHKKEEAEEKRLALFKVRTAPSWCQPEAPLSLSQPASHATVTSP